MSAPTTERRTELLLGAFPLVRFACSCGYLTELWAADLAYEAEAEIRCHLADVHGDELDVGRCAVCNQPTDHFHARSDLEQLDSWLCELHAPGIPVVVDQADTAEGDDNEISERAAAAIVDLMQLDAELRGYEP